MAKIKICDDVLIVELLGLHQVWAFKRRIRVPLAHVRGATADPGIVHEPKGIRGPGLHVLGAAVVGTFRIDGQKHFWDVRSRAQAVVIELTGETYDRLIVDVEDPAPQSMRSTVRCPTPVRPIPRLDRPGHKWWQRNSPSVPGCPESILAAR